MTLAELSERSGVSKSLLSMIERGRSVPTITTFQKVASALGISASALFSDDENSIPAFAAAPNFSSFGSPNKSSLFASRNNGMEAKRLNVVHQGKRKKLIMPWGASYEMLCPDLQRRIEFILLSYPVGARVEELYGHEGEECGVVLQGRFKGIIGEQEVILEPGDSIYFDSSIPHRWENAGEVEVKAIWAITPPSF